MLLYQIIHSESGTKYVGQTTRPPIKRWREHLYSLRKNRHENRYLQYAWNKYGEKAFQFQIVKEFVSLEELNKAEIELIKNESNLYNLSSGGNAHTHSAKTKKQIGEANKKPIVGMCIKTGEIRRYDSAADAKICGFNEKCVRKCALSYISTRKDGSMTTSISHKGWVWMPKEEATREKLKQKCDIARRGKVRKERAIIGMNVFTKKTVQFISAAEAGRNGFTAQTVYKACNVFSCVHNGFVWVYADVDNPQSLLRDKRKYVLSRPRVGPKSWQKKEI
jgi:group I intron endonuclease